MRCPTCNSVIADDSTSCIFCAVIPPTTSDDMDEEEVEDEDVQTTDESPASSAKPVSPNLRISTPWSRRTIIILSFCAGALIMGLAVYALLSGGTDGVSAFHSFSTVPQNGGLDVNANNDQVNETRTDEGENQQVALPLAAPDPVNQPILHAQEHSLLAAFRDSLNAITDTVNGVFISYNCADTNCFAWFDVEQPNGRAKRSFYCPSPMVDGYPVGALPKDGASWTIIARETVLETQVAKARGRGPVVHELIGLRPAVDVVPANTVKVTPEYTPPPVAPKASAPKGKVYLPADVDQQPSFPGGRSALRGYLAGRQYPAPENAAGTTGKVQVSFVVGRDGNVRDVRIERSPGYVNFDNEAKRMVQAMPRWIPGINNGEAVDVRMNATVDFSLNQ